MFGGKEFNDELGLDWYDFGWRNYDASLGRWMNIDPLSEKYYSSSNYNYALNSPILYYDPDGMKVYNSHTEEVVSSRLKLFFARLNFNNLDSNSSKKERKKAKRKLKRAEKNYNSAVEKFNDVQDVINTMRSIDREWFDKLDNLEDLKGNSIDVFVSSKQLGSEGFKNDKNEEMRYEARTEAFPLINWGIRARNKEGKWVNNRANIILDRSSNKVFWHEVGHLFFLTGRNTENKNITNSYWYYRIFLNKNPELIREGGHGEGDPSGDAAKAAEIRYLKKLKKSKQKN